MTTRQKLKGKNSSVPLKIQQNTTLKSIVFNPADSNEFIVLYNNEIILYKIDLDYEVEGEDVNENNRILKLKSLKG